MKKMGRPKGSKNKPKTDKNGPKRDVPTSTYLQGYIDGLVAAKRLIGQLREMGLPVDTVSHW